MKLVELDSWRQFPEAIERLRNDYGGKESNNRILFRGLADSDWSLATTLERTTNDEISVERYIQRTDHIVNEIETFTGKGWNLPEFPDICSEIKASQDTLCPHLPCYSYLAYLRHHGYPSPLLDWTFSPYIAAYFAFEGRCGADRCSIVALVETPDGYKMQKEGNTVVKVMGPHITAHPRHFAQKACYSIATHWENNRHIFRPHESVSRSFLSHQDVFVKLTIPRTDRVKALKQLEDFNINHFTLFQSEDALVRALGLRSFDLDNFA